MKGLTRRWRLPARAGPDESLRDRVLRARGLVDEDAVAAFLKPSLADVTDRIALPGMIAAIDVLVRSIHDRVPIVIYGDYDVDGITATAILWHIIRAIDDEVPVTSYVPHRLDEGYGLNAEAIETLAKDGARTIITVDCGVTAVDEAALAKDLGIELIITDHHRPRDDGQLPDAAAIVHPALPGRDYPFEHLSGAGVAWKVALHLARHVSSDREVGPRLRTVLMDGLTLAAMGTIADVMPLCGENRVIAHFGLKHLIGCGNIGVQALLDKAGRPTSNNDAQVVGFRLGPRLNAAGRMGHAALAMELFTSADTTRAAELAGELDRLNTSRQLVEREIFKQAREMAVEQGMTESGCHAIVLRHPDWHAGVVGIVCSRLVEAFGRPTLLFQDFEGSCRGSARSISGYSIYDGLTHCKAHLTTYGGHDMAAGMTVSSDAFDTFVRAITEHANTAIAPEGLWQELPIDTEASRGEITTRAVTSLLELRPFGRGNPAPRVLFRRLQIEDRKVFGKTNNHLKLRLRSAEPGHRLIEAIWWGQAQRETACARGRWIDLVGKLEIDDYNKCECLVIEDIAWVES